MSQRVTLFVFVCILMVGLAGCGNEPSPPAESKESKQASSPSAASKPKEESGPVYELTKEPLLTHTDWTSRNVAILGVKLGDVTRTAEKNLGKMENTRTLADDYLTIYQGNGVFVYTFKLTGRARKFEINQGFASKLADEKLKKLLTSGDVKYMREVLGQEEKMEENAEDNSTEYAYDSKGFRFVKYKVQGSKTVNALRFSELRRVAGST
jgi:hypothetical protein